MGQEQSTATNDESDQPTNEVVRRATSGKWRDCSFASLVMMKEWTKIIATTSINTPRTLPTPTTTMQFLGTH